MCPSCRSLSVSNDDTSVTRTIRNVVLHAGLRIDLELSRVDGAAEAGVVLARILAFAIALGVVNVLSRKVAAETLLGDLEFFGGVPVGWEVSNAQSREIFRPGLPRKPRTMTTFRTVWRGTLESEAMSTACEGLDVGHDDRRALEIAYLGVVAKPVALFSLATYSNSNTDVREGQSAHAQRDPTKCLTHKVNTLEVETGELGTTREEAGANNLVHVAHDVLNVTMAEGLVLEVRVARDVT